MSVKQNVDCCKILSVNRTPLCRANIGPFHALIYCCDTIYFYFGFQVVCTVKHLSYLCYLTNKIDFHPTCSESLGLDGRLGPWKRPQKAAGSQSFHHRKTELKPKSSPYHPRRSLTSAQRAVPVFRVPSLERSLAFFGFLIHSDLMTLHVCSLQQDAVIPPNKLYHSMNMNT